MFCKVNGDRKSQELHLSTCIQLRMTKHPSRKVMNFRHLLYCDTIETILTLPVRKGGGEGWDDPQWFFKHNSAKNKPKLAKFFLIQF